ncbi:hypothetical protein QWJ07_21680 [Frankia sp. RB7]|nr:hypothetical protein [Frankia sp. RB7]
MMTAEQFKALIASRRTSDRRLAARAALANPCLVDRSILEGAFYRETVPQIREQFGAALDASTVADAVQDEPPEKEARAIYDEAHVRATREVTERVLHQLNPLIGDIEQAASSEVAEFDESATKSRILQIKLQIEAITKLYHAAKPAKLEEFDLAPAVKNCLPNDLEHERCTINFIGETPMLALGDQSLISIAVTCGLRNAIEACIPVAAENFRPQIVINWGATDKEYWISIIDEGVGFRGAAAGAFELGATTKTGHSGNGLATVRTAMQSLSGLAELVPQKDRGCGLHLSWPKRELEKRA